MSATVEVPKDVNTVTLRVRHYAAPLVAMLDRYDSPQELDEASARAFAVLAARAREALSSPETPDEPEAYEAEALCAGIGAFIQVAAGAQTEKAYDIEGFDSMNAFVNAQTFARMIRERWLAE